MVVTESRPAPIPLARCQADPEEPPQIAVSELPPLGADPLSQVRHYRAAALAFEGVAQTWQNYATDLMDDRKTCAEDARGIAADSAAWAERQIGRAQQ